MIFNAYSDKTDGLYDVSIKSAGHIFARAGRRISRPNGRDDWLLFYVSKGCERFFFDGPADGGEGSFVIFRPHEKQEHVCVGEKNAEFYFVHFTAPDDFDLFGLESSRLYHARPDTAICDLFTGIITELQSKRPHYEKICVTKLFEIMISLARKGIDESDPYGRYGSLIFFVIQTMNTKFYENSSLEDYARMCRMSKFHFLRAFKDITGQSPIEYRNGIRMEHAKYLLEEEDLSISDIGSKIGYSSPSYFCDAFKKSVGISPFQYRQKIREGR